MIPVYSPSESGGNLRAFRGVVYKEAKEFQMDTRNHNPRVGGSSPSSATISTSEQTIISRAEGGSDGRFTDECKLSFPDEGDWEGWIEVWCREDTGNIDCVPDCLRPPILHLVTPEGWMKYPDMVPNTPYKLARFMHRHDGPQPPWRGTGMTPGTVKRLWEEAMAKLEAEEAAIEAEAANVADLYIIRSMGGPIKIGVSQEPEKRVRQLQTAHPYKLEILCVVPGGCDLEGVYHKRFAEHRLEGEWFAPHPDILSEVSRLREPGA